MGDDAWRFVGHDVCAQDLDLIRTVIGDYPTLSREELAATVCELLGWTRPPGGSKRANVGSGWSSWRRPA